MADRGCMHMQLQHNKWK